MSILADVGVNLLAAFIGFSLGWAARALRKGITSRRARHFWRPFVRSDLTAVVGRFLDFPEFEQTGLIGVGDANGLAELRVYLKNLGLQEIAVMYSDQLEGDATQSNLILIGGPDVNAISKEAMARIKTTFQFGDPARHEISIYDSADKRLYAPLREHSSNELVKDYGLFIGAPNPFDADSQMLLFAGSFGYGTWAAVRFAMSKAFLRNPIVSSHKPFEALIDTDIFRGAPQDIRLVALRPLEIKAGHFRRVGRLPPADEQEEMIGQQRTSTGGSRPPISQSIYDMPIEELELSEQSYNVLKRSGITKVGQVLTMSSQDLLAVRNLGEKSLNELKDSLRAHSLPSIPT